jgi:hypothetical protein
MLRLGEIKLIYLVLRNVIELATSFRIDRQNAYTISSVLMRDGEIEENVIQNFIV